MLVAAKLRHIAATKWGKRRYLVMDALLNPAKQEAAALRTRWGYRQESAKKSLHYRHRQEDRAASQ